MMNVVLQKSIRRDTFFFDMKLNGENQYKMRHNATKSHNCVSKVYRIELSILMHNC